MHDPSRRCSRATALLFATATGVLLSPPPLLFAGGMALIMQNGAHLGQAYSAGASAEDASTVYYNPAGLMLLDDSESLLAFTYIAHSGGFENAGSFTGTPAATMPTSGNDGGTVGDNRIVPAFYAAHPLSEKLAFGFGLSVPYGLATEYDAGWVGRYHALKSELKTLNLSPALAWRPTDHLAIGFGYDWQKVDATLTNAVDFGLLGLLNGIPGMLPGSTDGFARVTGDDTSHGFNVGALFDAPGGLRVGLHYRSKMEHQLRGPATFTDVPAPFAPMFANQNAVAPLTLPEKWSVSLHYDVSPSLALTADWSWWNWSRFESLTVQFENPALNIEQPQDWQDASIYSLGARWQQSDTLTWRAGVAFNETPVRSAALRSARIPDADRTWLCVGASWRLAENLRADVGYAHLFVDEASTTATDGAGHFLVGEYSTSVNIFSAQGTLRF